MTNLFYLVCHCSALLSIHGSSKSEVAPPGELSEIESLLQDVTEFEDRTRTAIKAMESTLPAIPTDENLEQSIESFSKVDESTVGDEGAFSGCGKNVSTLVVSKDGKVASVVPPCDHLEGSPSAAIVNETELGVISTNDDSKCDVSSFQSVKIQMKLTNREMINITKIMFLEKESRRIAEKFGLSEPHI